ncbi:MAG: FtsW/RodA/SpoVE family cell cycle protein [Prolixibacteraceae bacterium]|jgi:cell division protein FtsW|nr:FtsW/RodA/SpoVE family cell cycle protein [Prolixibacteraceae bacterium]
MKFSDYISRLKGDKKIWIVIFVMSFISILVVYSSTGALAFRRSNGNTSFYIFRQVIVQMIGFMFILLMLKFVRIKLYNKYANLALMAAVGFILLGILIGRGSGRTIPLGFFSFQPAELAKVAVIMWVARILSGTGESEDSRRKSFFKILLVMGLMALLLLKVNFSSAVLLMSTAFVMMFVAQMPLRYLGGTMLAGLILAVSLFLVRKQLPEIVYKGTRVETVFNRIERYISGSDPKQDEGLTQDEFAKIAIYNGGFFGVGVGKGDISNRMSAAYNDFVFAIIVEEYGLFFAAFIVLLYLIILTRGLMIIKACKRTFPLYLATGAVTMLMMQALVNMGVSSGAIPVTGQPLPWISWGGTSQVFTAFIFGFLLSISAENQAEMFKQDDVTESGEDDDFSEEEILLSNLEH